MGSHLVSMMICDTCEAELRADPRWTTEYGQRRLSLRVKREGWRYDEADDEATCAACLAKEEGLVRCPS